MTELLINSRSMTFFDSLSSEQYYDPGKNYLFDLSYQSVLHLEGERAAEFLQGQLSCDLREVDDLQIRQGAHCNIQGRVLALLDVVKWKDKGLHLILPSDLLNSTQSTLKKPAMFSRVSIQAQESYDVFGLYIQNISDLIPFQCLLNTVQYGVTQETNFCGYCIGSQRFIFLIEASYAQKVREQFSERTQLRGSLAWHALQLQSGQFDIYPETSGSFLPHRLGLQDTGYLNFKKGCYKGQEIIARTHYRAKLKHELKCFLIQCDEPLKSGQKLFDHSHNQEVGVLIDYCPSYDSKSLVIISLLMDHPKNMRFENHTSTTEFLLYRAQYI